MPPSVGRLALSPEEAEAQAGLGFEGDSGSSPPEILSINARA